MNKNGLGRTLLFVAIGVVIGVGLGLGLSWLVFSGMADARLDMLKAMQSCAEARDATAVQPYWYGPHMRGPGMWGGYGTWGGHWMRGFRGFGVAVIGLIVLGIVLLRRNRGTAGTPPPSPPAAKEE